MKREPSFSIFRPPRGVVMPPETKFKVAVLLISLCVLTVAGWCSQAVAAQGDYVEDEVLVLCDQDSDQSAQAAIKAISGADVQKKITFPKSRLSKKSGNNHGMPRHSVLRVKLPKGKTVGQAIAEAKRKGLRVEPNYKVRTTAIPNDALFIYMWALRNTGQTGGTSNADIDAISAWDITTGSDDVIIAIIDTGIDYTHPDLASNIWTNPGEIAGNDIDDDHNGYIDDVYGYDFCTVYEHVRDSDPMDEHNHGTHVAGTIGAVGNNSSGVTGINWRCKLMACRFLNEDGYGSVADAIDAINYAVANGAKVLNKSWGGSGYSSSLAAAITNAKDNGVLFVAAAGNDSTDNDSTPQYPACYQIENVIAVAATDDDDALASFSNYGQNTVHLGAPGVSILSTVLNNEYRWYNGTSMATPHVSGAAALLLAQNPAIALNELKNRLIGTGDTTSSLAGKTISGRRLNAYNALTAQSGLSIVEPNDGVTWARGFEWHIKWLSIGGGDAVNIYLIKPDDSTLQLAADAPNTGSYYWEIPDSLAVGSGYKILIDDGVNTGQNDAGFTISENPADYFTELFNSYARTFDLSNKSLLLTPDESASHYSACIKTIAALPIDPAGGEILTLDDDDSELVTLGTFGVPFYDTNYSSFYVGSNGYITFGSPDYTYLESSSAHFNTKRISALFRDLNPEAAGSITVKQLDSKIAITWENVPEYGGDTGNTFQIELFDDGKIRLSWLNIDASFGLVGISQGLGQPADYLNSNLSNHGQCEPLLESLEITGPNSIEENNTAQFTCTAHYEDAADEDISADGAVWSVDSNDDSIDDTGLLTTGGASDYRQCTIQAQFGGKSAVHSITIIDNTVHIITVKKAAVKAGRAGPDSITLSGGFDATPALFAAADNVKVQFYSATDDCLVYEQIIDTSLFNVKNTVYTYKGRSDGIKLLKFNITKNTFQLKARNIDLTGLRCPFYVLIHMGYYIAMGTADETIVNGSRSIPVRLLSGYADSLAVSKIKVRGSSKPINDRISVIGTFTVNDLNAPGLTQGLIISWGPQIWTIPEGKFSPVKAGLLRCNYQTPEGASIQAVFNFNSCSFKLKIKQTTVAPKTGNVDFGLVFGNFAETVTIRN
jgi:subtilisin family serine protease